MRRWPSKSVAPFIQAWFVPVLTQGDVDCKWKSFPAKFTNCGLLVMLLLQIFVPPLFTIPFVIPTHELVKYHGVFAPTLQISAPELERLGPALEHTIVLKKRS